MELTSPAAVSKNQRVFDLGDVVLYARADGTCVSLIKGNDAAPDSAPDTIDAVDAERLEGD